MTIPTPSPNYRTGKICYLEIPAIDIAESAQFYQRVFGWHIRQRNDGSTAFDDTTGEVSGTWVLGRPPSTDPGLLVSIMVASAATTIEAIIAAGGKIAARCWVARRSCTSVLFGSGHRESFLRKGGLPLCQ